jgi:molybdopterin-guanine dinucleotide biosynthesis protein A
LKETRIGYSDHAPIVAVILAGGQARRMGGGDKCLVELCRDEGEPRVILDYVLQVLTAQHSDTGISDILINANGNPTRFSRFECSVVADSLGEGPLAGVYSALLWTKNNRPNAKAVLSVAGDTPFFPKTLLSQLWMASHGGNIISIASCYRDINKHEDHPVFAIWPIDCAEMLKFFLENSLSLKIMTFANTYGVVRAFFSQKNPPCHEVFFNINTPADKEQARARIAVRPDKSS